MMPGDGSNEAQDTAPTFPTPGSIKDKVLSVLRAGESLTSLQAWTRFEPSRLAALIHQLRRAGWSIHCEDTEVVTASGRCAHVGRYWIEAKQ